MNDECADVALLPFRGCRSDRAVPSMASETARVAALCNDASETGELDLRNCELMAVPEAVFFLLKSVCRRHN